MAKSKIKNLIVAPLIASAIFLSSGTATFASRPIERNQVEVHNISNTENASDTKKGITGRVTRVSGSIIIVSTKDDTEYTVDVSEATIMKEGLEPNDNPSLVNINDIKVGDEIMVRGTIIEQD
jgi:preprotein translocase subunit YajC